MPELLVETRQFEKIDDEKNQGYWENCWLRVEGSLDSNCTITTECILKTQQPHECYESCDYQMQTYW